MRAVLLTSVLALLATGAAYTQAAGARPEGGQDSAYARLIEAQSVYRVIEARGGWIEVPSGITIRLGDEGEAVAMLRSRLRASGDLDGSSTVVDESIFDSRVDAAVRRFQQRHGLEIDGIVGRQTIAALNVSVESRIRQIEVNLERWRRLPESLGPRFAQVNIPGFSMEVVEGGRIVLAMKVIVGKRSTRTPLFSTQITEVVLAPYWNVPRSIAVNEILPAERKRPGYLVRNHIRVLPDGSLRQDPGPENPLGRVKFTIPNPYGVGLHDTPARTLFESVVCAFSHGCMRLEHPLELAEYLLKEMKWSRTEIDQTIERWRETRIALANPMPLHVLYWTAWVDEQGVLNFRPDIYGRDRALAEELASGLYPANSNQKFER